MSNPHPHPNHPSQPNSTRSTTTSSPNLPLLPPHHKTTRGRPPATARLFSSIPTKRPASPSFAETSATSSNHQHSDPTKFLFTTPTAAFSNPFQSIRPVAPGQPTPSSSTVPDTAPQNAEEPATKKKRYESSVRTFFGMMLRLLHTDMHEIGAPSS